MEAVCADETPPTEGSDFSTCTSVVWEPHPSIVPGLSLEGALQVFGAILLLWVIGYAGGVLRRAMRS